MQHIQCYVAKLEVFAWNDHKVYARKINGEEHIAICLWSNIQNMHKNHICINISLMGVMEGGKVKDY